MCNCDQFHELGHLIVNGEGGGGVYSSHTYYMCTWSLSPFHTTLTEDMCRVPKTVMTCGRLLACGRK